MILELKHFLLFGETCSYFGAALNLKHSVEFISRILQCISEGKKRIKDKNHEKLKILNLFQVKDLRRKKPFVILCLFFVVVGSTHF